MFIFLNLKIQKIRNLESQYKKKTLPKSIFKKNRVLTSFLNFSKVYKASRIGPWRKVLETNNETDRDYLHRFEMDPREAFHR